VVVPLDVPVLYDSKEDVSRTDCLC